MVGGDTKRMFDCTMLIGWNNKHNVWYFVNRNNLFLILAFRLGMIRPLAPGLLAPPGVMPIPPMGMPPGNIVI